LIEPSPNPDGSKTPKRLLVIRLGAIGDVLLAIPLVRMLKNACPDCAIDFLVKNAYVSLLESNPHIDRVLAFSPRGGIREMARMIRRIRDLRYDAVIDLQGNLRSRMVTLASRAAIRSRARLNRWRRFLLVHLRWDTYRTPLPVPLKYLRAAPFPVADDGKGLELWIPADAEANVRFQLEARGIRNQDRIVGLAPGAGRATKRWPAEGFAETGQALSQKGWKIVVVGGEGDSGICGDVHRNIRMHSADFSGRLSLVETAALIRRCDLLVTNDTGAMHMASAVGTKILAVFGPTTRHFGFFPFRSEAAVIEKPLGCRPCSYHGTERCPKTHFRCMLDISSREAVEQALDLLNAR